MAHSAVIMGLGRFGGGIGAARFLAQQGHDVLVTDLGSKTDLAAPIERLRDLIDAGSITLRLGEHNVSDFTTAELVVVNPAVKRPWDNRFVRAAQAAGIRTTTEAALAIDEIPASTPTIGVTGSAGKSTTSAMIRAGMLSTGRRVLLGGNFGGSLLDDPDSLRAADAVILELSSAQLWWLDQPDALAANRWVDVGVITNIAPNHLDWHGSFDHYAGCKHVMISRLARGATAVLGPGLDEIPVAEGIARIIASDADAPGEIVLPGVHNRVNAAIARAACAASIADTRGSSREIHDRVSRAIAGFAGLPHRLELVAEVNGVAYFNDSKATTADATRLALDALGDRPVHLIVGGSDKGVDLAPLARLAARARSLLCVGQTGPTIARLAGTTPLETLNEAVARAAASAEPGDAVLLSPGCASFDQFISFEARGETFRRLVADLARQPEDPDQETTP